MTDIAATNALSPEQLRWTLDPKTLPFATTADVDPLGEIIGQDRGVAAVRFAVGMDKKGYNLFVTGSPNSGRLATIKRLLAELSRKDKQTTDFCYVNNFKAEESPVLLTFAAGRGRLFKKDVDDFLEALKQELPELFESQEYIARKKEIMEAHEKKTREFFTALESKVKDAGFVLVNMKVGQTQRPEVVPMIDGEPVHILNLEEKVDKGRFPRAEFEELSAKHKELKEEIDSIFLDIRELQKEVKKKNEDMDRHLFLNTAEELMRPLRRAYAEAKIQTYLDQMLEHMADNLDAFRSMGQQPREGQIPGMIFMPPPVEMVMHPYQVNLLVDNTETKGQPVIVESYPTYRNLFGSIERVMDRNGVWHTDYTKIKAGSFVKASGGYLVINLMDAIMEPWVWQTLKRALKTEEIEIQTFDPAYMFTSTGIKPEPIPMDVKVVVLADARLYHLLSHYDEDVVKIFKVRADFDTSMDRDDQALVKMAGFVRSAADKDELRPFDNTAVAALLEQAVRMAGRREKISTAFSQLEDLLMEADHFAAMEESENVAASHVLRAIEERVQRSGLVEEKIQEMIDRGSLFIDVDGAKPGQVNGLAVYSMGDHMFGKPSRITAVTAMGKEGIINIEREADLSGAIHNKGVLILAGYLRRMFAQDRPLTLGASIAFEQSYGGVDGDSASSTELYALFSSLSGVPIRQGIAVTGSVNQRGEVQPIGGVNEKIEGFYQCCKSLGLTKEQGVMIPEANVKDLQLRQEVVDAVKAGEFTIWSVKTIEQGIELLTGVPAGERGEDGEYPEGTVYRLVEDQLKEYAEGLKKFAQSDEDKGEDAKGSGCSGCDEKCG